MKKLLMLIVVAVGGWFVYMNWDSRNASQSVTDEHAMKQYKQSIDKARDVEKTLEKARRKID